MGNPVPLGTAASTEGSGSQTTVITTTAAHNAGEPIVVAIAFVGKSTPTVTDQVGNTYSSIVSMGSNPLLRQYRSSGAIALPSGNTITIGSAGLGTGSVCAIALACPGYPNSTDATGTNSGASGEPTCPIDPANAAALQIAFAQQASGLVGAGGEDPEWTSLPHAHEPTTSNLLTGAWRIRSDPSADEWNPETGLSVAWVAVAQAIPAGGHKSFLLELGVT